MQLTYVIYVRIVPPVICHSQVIHHLQPKFLTSFQRCSLLGSRGSASAWGGPRCVWTRHRGGSPLLCADANAYARKVEGRPALAGTPPGVAAALFRSPLPTPSPHRSPDRSRWEKARGGRRARRRGGRKHQAG